MSTRRNLWLCCLFSALHMSLFPVAIITLFWKHEIGLDMTEIMMLQAYFGICIALFEFPSGYLADRLGYRKALAAASLLLAVGWVFYCFSSNLWFIVLAETIIGIAISLISGSDQAILYESLKDIGEESTYTKWHGRIVFFGQVGEGTAALFAGVLYVWWVRLPFVLEVVIWIINFGVALLLVEPTRIKSMTRTHWEEIKTIGSYIFIERPHLRKVMMFSVLIGLTSFVPVWMIQLHALEVGNKPEWLGPFWAIANYMVAIGAVLSSKLKLTCGVTKTLGFCILLTMVGFLGLGSLEYWWVIVFYYALTLMRGINSPILAHMMQDLVTSEHRAAMMSVKSLVFRAAFFVIGPIVGWFVDRDGSQTVFWYLGWCFGLLLIFGLLDIRRKTKLFHFGS